MASPFNIYATEHKHSRNVCEALAQGTGFKLVPPAPLLEGGVAMYGFLRGLLPTLNKARQEGRSWAYIDRGYFRASYGEDYTGYFRITRGAFQHDGRGAFPEGAARWDRLALKLAPWRRGKHVLVCPPSDVFTTAVGGFTAAQWVEQTLATLRANTARSIIVRNKPRPGEGRPLAFDLQDCHALVTYMSNTAVEAVLSGVPVFCTGRCAAVAMGKAEVAEIEDPVYPERAGWAAALAANQWTLAELRTGAANHLFT